MKLTEKIAENKNFTAINVGNLDDIKSYSLIHPKTGKEVKGKLFLKEPTKATGTEISFTTIPSKTELGYFHLHYNDEETYIIIKGSGFFQVDDDCFPIKAGSIIRVAPEGVRSLCNTSEEEMVYLCIQSKKDSLKEYFTNDGKRLEHNSKFPDFK